MATRSEDAVADGLTKAVRNLVVGPAARQFFEVTTALALKHFGQKGVERGAKHDRESASPPLSPRVEGRRRGFVGLIVVSSMLLSLRRVLVAGSIGPTLFNPMFASHYSDRS